MRRILAVLLTGLTIFLHSCTGPPPVLVRPGLDPPARPALVPVQWHHADGRHCLDDAAAKALLINIGRLQAHIDVLEGYIQACGDK